jgi:hypothetical protein
VRVIDPGHQYGLAHLDDNLEEVLTFVKREGPKYPGNEGSHPGTNLQECWRAEIARLKYLDAQQPCQENYDCINWLRHCILRLQQRAARIHQRDLPVFWGWIENQPFCSLCGHIGCLGTCRLESDPESRGGK